ncbi:MAG: YbaY family lipoprotein [Bryobacterales bacterium]|nr:YbaY family lipoprotein [Bryobacterales bacterium]
MIVTGEVRFAEPPRLPAGAVAHVRLLDTTYADAAAKVVAERKLTDIAGESFEFALEASDIDPLRRYTVSVHISAQGGNRIQPGDYLNTQDYPVLTRSYPSRVSVIVSRVR